jgi:hypothetical protein
MSTLFCAVKRVFVPMYVHTYKGSFNLIYYEVCKLPTNSRQQDFETEMDIKTAREKGFSGKTF